MKNGLLLHMVRAIVETRAGYLAVGIFKGLARFDGLWFKVFDVANALKSHSISIENLCEDWEGQLWIGDHLGRINVPANACFQRLTLPKH